MMNCADARKLIEASIDGELDAAKNLEVVTHLATCASCAAERKSLLALREAISVAAPRYEAPAALRRKLRAAIQNSSPSRPRWSWTSLWPVLTASAACVALAFFAGAQFGASSPDVMQAREIAGNHFRSLQAGHLMDVASTDQHTVKPWFAGKVDFAPPVKDLVAEGFPLVGGRLDYVAGQPAAALIFKRQQHTINLFIWPKPGASDASETASTERGYHLVHWTRDGMNFWAVSDLNEKELMEFARLFQTSPAP